LPKAMEIHEGKYFKVKEGHTEVALEAIPDKEFIIDGYDFSGLRKIQRNRSNLTVTMPKPVATELRLDANNSWINTSLDEEGNIEIRGVSVRHIPGTQFLRFSKLGYYRRPYTTDRGEVDTVFLLPAAAVESLGLSFGDHLSVYVKEEGMIELAKAGELHPGQRFLGDCEVELQSKMHGVRLPHASEEHGFNRDAFVIVRANPNGIILEDAKVEAGHTIVKVVRATKPSEEDASWFKFTLSKNLVDLKRNDDHVLFFSKRD